MLATKNQGSGLVISLLGMALLLSACSPSGPGALSAGRKSLDAGKLEAAIAELETAVRLMPTNAAALNYLGVAYHQSGQWTNAVAAYSQALRFNRDLLEVRYNLGCLHLEQNNPEAAAVELFAYTARRANDASGWIKLGQAQQQTADLAAAEKSFREALRCDSQNSEAFNRLGMVLAQRNRLRDAADCFTAALKLEPKSRAALLNYATVQQQLNNPTEAVKFYRAYLALQPRPSDWEAVNATVNLLAPPAVVPALPSVASNLVASTHSNVTIRPVATPITRLQSNQPPVAKAESLVSTNKAASPASSVAVPAISTAQNLKPNTEPAAKLVADDSRVAVIRTENPAPVSGVASPTESKGLFAKLNPFKREAKAGSTESATAKPVAPKNPPKPAITNAEPGSTLAGGQLKTGDRKAAEAELARGQQEQRAKRLAEALQFYRRAVSLDQSYFEAHYCVGWAAFEIRNFKLAIAAWQDAVALRPDSDDARYNLALSFKADGQFRPAADELEKLLAVHPDEARAHLIMGILYADKLQDIPRARQHYQRVLQLDPRNPQAEAIRYWLVANPR